MISTLAPVAGAALFATDAAAQSVSPPPVRSSVDQNGVDLVSGTLFVASPSISVGQPGYGGLAYQRTYDSSEQAWRDNYHGTINASGSTYTVTLMGSSATFTESGGTFTPTDADGSSLTYNSGTQTYTYTTRNGVVAVYSEALASTQPTEANEGRVTTITAPSGEVTTFTYTTLSGSGFLAHRLQSVTNNLGYQLSFTYQTNNADSTGLNLTKVTAINNAVDYCNPTSNGCTGFSQTWPSLTFASGSGFETVTDTLNRQTRYAFTSGVMTGIRRPTSGSDNVTISYSAGRVSSVAIATGGTPNTWTYGYEDALGVRLTTVTDPLSHQRVVTSDLSTSLVTADRDALNRVTAFQYDGSNRLTRITMPEGNYVEYTYDTRGNITTTTNVAKSGSGLSNIVTTASFSGTCGNPVTCNLPNSVTDARGFRTDFTYDSTHGGVLTVTSPAPSGSAPVGSGTRPQTRFSYTSMYAYYKNSGGSIVQAASPVFRPTLVSACATTASCTNGADETRTTIAYGSTGVANNRVPLSVTAAAGNGAVSVTSAQTYDHVTNLLTVDGPLSGTADTTRFRYDAGRQRIGIVGPDPDGGGALKHRALRFTYNADGQITAAERGTVDSQSDAHWNAFAVLETANTAYDVIGRPVREDFAAGGSTHAVVQYAYDAANRLDCTALRMNPAVFGSLPAACTLSTQGANGPDRITRNVYSNADELTQVQAAYGTALQQNAMTATYSANGLQATLTDAGGNLTTFEYDGFDRLRKIRFPHPTSAGTSSTTDYEEYTYDAGSNVTLDRRRDGATITLAYDNLNRLITQTPSTGSVVSYQYDLFGRMSQAAFSGHTLSFGYDQLSRNTSQGGPHGTVSYLYDAASRRTRITWPDAFYAVYDYDVAGAVTAIRENGATSGAGVLATYAYDNLGRRTTLTRGNGVVTSYAYDSASRLDTLTHNLAGTSHDQTYDFSYNAAFQALERDGSNAAYDWAPSAPGTASYADNGLNQYTSVAGASQSYDGRGNLTGTGATTYAYDIYNRLTSAGSATLSYDPVGRLYETVGGGATTRFAYDGLDLIGEYNTSGTLLRRYVHGPSFDEPLVWYEGSGTGDRRWLTSDQLGSVVAVTNASGAATSINSYDEYGQPGASNAGRFQYTGQAWIAEASLYHYKARAYSPTLGRFLQTDPILYGGGMNLYAYVGNDPVNASDPWGADECPEDTICVPAPCRGAACDRYDISLFLEWLNGPEGLTFIQDMLSAGPGDTQCHMNTDTGTGILRVRQTTPWFGADNVTIQYSLSDPLQFDQESLGARRFGPRYENPRRAPSTGRGITAGSPIGGSFAYVIEIRPGPGYWNAERRTIRGGGSTTTTAPHSQVIPTNGEVRVSVIGSPNPQQNANVRVVISPCGAP